MIPSKKTLHLQAVFRYIKCKPRQGDDMETYTLENANGYIVFKKGGETVLVDTGAPATVRKDSMLAPLAGFDTLEEHSGQPVTTIMGMTDISRQKVLIDSVASTVSFGDDLTLEGEALDCTYNGYLFLDAEANGRKGIVVFDTGAPIAYVRSDLVQGRQPIGEKADFNPHLGNFTTPIYNTELVLHGTTYAVEAGVVPEEGREMFVANFSMLGVSPLAIVGGALMAGRRTLIDIAAGKITLG